MKCHYKEKQFNDFCQELRSQYAKLHINFVAHAFFVVLAEQYQFGRVRMSRIAARFMDDWIDELNRVSTDTYMVQTREGLKQAGEDAVVRDAMQTMIDLQERRLIEIGFYPDFERDLDADNKWIEQYRRRGHHEAALFRTSWYLNWEALVDRCFIGYFMVLLNQEFGFGADRLMKWYGNYLVEHREFIKYFIAAKDIYDDKMEKKLEELINRLARHNIYLTCDKNEEGNHFVSITKNNPDVKAPAKEIPPEIAEKIQMAINTPKGINAYGLKQHYSHSARS